MLYFGFVLFFPGDSVTAETVHSTQHPGEVRLQPDQPQQTQVLAHGETQQSCVQGHGGRYSRE